LKKQWTGLFQRLLNEARNKQLESKRIDVLSNQFEDLKTAILTSIGSNNEREVARSVVRFRRLVDFLRNLRLADYSSILNGAISWEVFIRDVVGISNVIDVDSIASPSNRHIRFRTLMIKSDNSFYEIRFGREYLDELALEFEAFNTLSNETKNIVFHALADMRSGLMIIRYHREDYREYLDKFQQEYLINRGLFQNEDEVPET